MKKPVFTLTLLGITLFAAGLMVPDASDACSIVDPCRAQVETPLGQGTTTQIAGPDTAIPAQLDGNAILVSTLAGDVDEIHIGDMVLRLTADL